MLNISYLLESYDRKRPKEIKAVKMTGVCFKMFYFKMFNSLGYFLFLCNDRVNLFKIKIKLFFLIH